MIWLTWRQSRVQVAAVYGAIAALLLFLAITAANLPTFDGIYLQRFKAEGLASAIYLFASAAVLCVPAIVGVFWGAPLVARELEAGTHRLAWNQSVTRTRWLATKLGVTGLAAMSVTGVASLALIRWSHSLDTALNAGQSSDGPLGVARIMPLFFGARGIAPIAYTAFALALGVTAGIVVRRVVPAMAITLAVFVVVQIATPTFVRAHIGPTTTSAAITAKSMGGMMASIGKNGTPSGPVRDLTVRFEKPGSWIIANETVDRAGRVLHDLPSWFALCVPAEIVALPGGGPIDKATSAACFQRVASEGYTQRITYQPPSRYWTLQWIETAIFLALAAALSACSFWWLRHRVT
jgi:hypothetical protein